MATRVRMLISCFAVGVAVFLATMVTGVAAHAATQSGAQATCRWCHTPSPAPTNGWGYTPTPAPTGAWGYTPTPAPTGAWGYTPSPAPTPTSTCHV